MEDQNIKAGTLFLQNNDLVMKDIITKVGICQLTPSTTYFKNIIRSIISQQLSVKAAGTIIKRFNDLVGEINPENILKFTKSDFREVGISGQKASYILDISNRIADKSFSFDNIIELQDEELIEKITSLKGVGNWTAQMFLIFSLNRLNILPLDDVGFQRAVCKYYKIEKADFPKKILKISKKWGNYKTLAVWYLWEALDIL